MPKNKNNILPNPETGQLTVNISLITFKEDGFFFIYSPALHVYGFDKNKKAALKSFDKQLSIFLTYTSNNNILVESLIKMGWKNIGAIKKPKMIMPELDELLEIDPEFRKIHSTKECRIKIKEIQLPIQNLNPTI
jgi:hypothetical protein